MATETEIDLKPFCLHGKYERYPALSMVFVRGDWKYATDGRIAARIPSSGEPDSVEKSPKVNEVFDPVNFQKDFNPLPASFRREKSETGICKSCDGTGETNDETIPLGTIECDDCDGTGEDYCDHCGKTDDCDSCDGKGSWEGRPCPNCKGTGSVDFYKMELDGIEFDAYYIDLIAKMPKPEYRIVDEGTMAFRFTGGQGILKALA